MSSSFIRGLDLCERFFHQLIRPLLDQYYSSLQYTACRLGPGSDVLSFDTIQSCDHDWGPKCDLLLDNDTLINELNLFFQFHLREKTIDGYSTQFQIFQEHDGQQTLINDKHQGTCHGIRIMTMKQFFYEYLQWSIDDDLHGLTSIDWLTFPSQHLATIARGRVFYSTHPTSIERIRSQLKYYPDDIWLYLIGSCWQRIGQEEHLMGRAGQVEDELGSTLIANRLVRDLMRLIFLYEREYYPYAKWFGRAFRQWTKLGVEFEVIFRQIQLADHWLSREMFLSQAYQRIARLYAEKFFPETSTIVQVSQFHQRPFQVINGGVIAEKIFSQIQNDQLRQLTKIESVDLFSDSTDALSIELREKMKKIFE